MVRPPPKRPPPAPLSDWLEDVLRLPVGLSADPGPIKLAPYMRDIADAITDPRIERVTCIKSARVGWTSLMSGGPLPDQRPLPHPDALADRGRL